MRSRHLRKYRSVLVLLSFLLAAAPSAAAAGGGRAEVEERAAALAELLDGYGKPGCDSTIPIEQAIIDLRDLGAAAELLEHVSHARFGPTVVWAVASIGHCGDEEPVLAALQQMGLDEQVAASIHVAAFRTPKARQWLAALAATEGLDEQYAEYLSRARLRAGDPAVLKEVRSALKDEDPAAVARALLAMGESRDPDLLAEIVNRLDDERGIAELDLRSRYGTKIRTEDERGWITERTVLPVLETVGDAALEAANRLHAPTTPEYIAWWYEIFPGPLFSGDDARDRLRSYFQADQRARQAKAVSGAEAFSRLLDARREELKDRVLTDVTFAYDRSGWTIRFDADGTPVEGKVTPKGEIRG